MLSPSQGDKLLLQLKLKFYTDDGASHSPWEVRLVHLLPGLQKPLARTQCLVSSYACLFQFDLREKQTKNKTRRVGTVRHLFVSCCHGYCVLKDTSKHISSKFRSSKHREELKIRHAAEYFTIFKAFGIAVKHYLSVWNIFSIETRT